MTHIASARFSDQRRPLQEWQRIGPNYVGRPHPSQPGQALALTTALNCAEWHATKHTGQGEWAPGTTTQEYLEDIRTSVLHESAVLHVGGQTVRFPGSSTTRYAPRAGVRTDMDRARAELKKATPKPGWQMLTVYGMDTRRLCTGYQLEADKALATVNAWSSPRCFP